MRVKHYSGLMLIGIKADVEKLTRIKESVHLV